MQNDKAPQHQHDSFEDAREQAAQCLGFVASERIKGFEIPNPSMIDDDQRKRLDQLDLDTESWDRHPDEFSAPALEALSEKVSHVVSAHPDAETLAATLVDVFVAFAKEHNGVIIFRGALKEPNRKNNELVEHYNVQQAKAIFGEQYDAFRKAGGRASDVTISWAKMNKVLADRRAADSKSGQGDRPVEVVPEADQG